MFILGAGFGKDVTKRLVRQYIPIMLSEALAGRTALYKPERHG